MPEELNRRAQPEPQAFPPITEQQSQWGRLYTAANALVAKMGYHGSMQADSIEMESLKDKLHDIDGGEWMPGLMPTAQPEPAAPAVDAAMKRALMKSVKFIDAAPSVAPEPVAHCKLTPSGKIAHFDGKPMVMVGPVGNDCHPTPLSAHPPRAPLTDEQIAAIVLRTVYEGDASIPYRDAWAAEIGVPFARAIEAVHGIRGQG